MFLERKEMTKMLLTTKSILDCDEFEEEIHHKEINDLIQFIQKIEDVDCAFIIKYVDKGHSSRKETILSGNLHNFIDMVEYCDIKNGIDLLIKDNQFLTIRTYGQGYTMEIDGNEEYNLISQEIVVMPYVDDYKFINIVPLLLDIIRYETNIKII